MTSRHAAPQARRARFGPPLPPAFYDRDAELVARDLLGMVLVHRTADGRCAGRIVETEAYLGPHDPACHAAAGRTPRTEPLHGPPGTAYVYFIYGMHWCFNAVTREEGYGSAVLIRAIEPLIGLPLMRRRRGAVRERDLANGPGKLCRALDIDRRHNGARLDRGPLRIVAGTAVADRDVIVTPRIGISKAADWPLRFVVAASQVSR
ncbi:MAG: DNA-3-methyladenine glycosylase [Gemmatimonadaceae bacterium]|nr:DNA-3-methyladenine glycosylase [Gemmatimonadaceae bacterium]